MSREERGKGIECRIGFDHFVRATARVLCEFGCCRQRQSDGELNTSFSFIADEPRPKDINFHATEAFVNDFINCSVSADPTPTVTVRMNEKSASGRGKASFRIPKDTKAGTYTFVCEARNEIGKIDKTQQVIVRSE